MRYIFMAVSIVIIGLALLFAAAIYAFNRAFTRERIDLDNLTPIPIEHFKRFLFARDWLNHPNRNLKPLTVTSHDGLTLHANLLPSPGSRKFVVCVHGYHSASLLDFGCPAKYFHRQHYNVLLTDMRAHGASSGHIISFGLDERVDLRRWVQLLIDDYGHDIEIYLMGLSMGATTVMLAAGAGMPPAVKCVIADCGFTSPERIVRHVMLRDYHLNFPPMLWALNVLFRLFAGHRLDDESTLDAVKKSRVPIMFVHGGSDEFVPTQMSIENFNACASAKALFIVPGAGHAISYLVDTRGYISEFERFIGAHI